MYNGHNGPSDQTITLPRPINIKEEEEEWIEYSWQKYFAKISSQFTTTLILSQSGVYVHCTSKKKASAEVWYIYMSPATLINISRLWLHWKTLLGAKWWWWWSLVRSWCDRGVPWAHMTTSYPLTSDHWLWAHLTLLTISSYGHPRHSWLYHSQLQLEKAFQWQAHIAHSMAYHLWMCNVNGILDYKSDLWL